MLSIWKHAFAVAVLFALAIDARPPKSELSSNADELSVSGDLRKRAPKKKQWDKKGLKKNMDVDGDLFHIVEGMAINGKRAKEAQRAVLKKSNKAMELEQKFIAEKTKEAKGKRKGQFKSKGQKSKRNFIYRYDSYNNDWYWPNGIVPYTVDYNAVFGSYAAEAQARVEETAADFQAKTCVSLVRKTQAEINSEGIEYFVKLTGYSGCWSYVGRTLWRDPYVGQEVNLQPSGCLSKSTVIHEFCHAIGMNHEQSRSDRDNHLRVLFENIRDDKESNLHKRTTLDNNPYDYYSLMQYGLGSFTSKSWTQSMEFRDPDLEFLAGGSPELSFYDAMDITRAYDCAASCSQTDDDCLNGGFINHNCQCYCPEGLGGADCNTIQSSTCGGIIDLVPGQSQTIQSPNYPNNYNTNQICYWLLRAQNTNQRIMIEMNDFDVAANSYNSACYHWLELRYNLIGQPGRKNCGDQFYTNKITSTEYGNPNLMMLVFDTATITGAAAKRGFSLTARAIDTSSNSCSSPPTVSYSTNNYVTGSVGAVVRYECNYGYHMVGSGKSVTCQADGTWSNVGFQCNPRNNVFSCNFESGNCNIAFSSTGSSHNWQRQTENGNSFLALSPASTASGWIQAKFTLPQGVMYTSNDYCLSFRLKRVSTSTNCAYLYVNEPHPYTWWNRWRYTDCNAGGWEIFQGDINPWLASSSQTELIFTAEGNNLWAMNMQIDDIHISDGLC